MKIFFRYLSAAIVVACSAIEISAQDKGDWGHLTGQIVLKGDVPSIPEEVLGDNADKKIAMVDGKTPLDDNLIVNEKKEIKDVLVMMFLEKDQPEPTYHPSYAVQKSAELTLDNKDCRFVPHSLFVRPGQKLILKNSDSVGHNCHIITFNNEHNVNLPANGNAELTLEKPEKAPGEVKCDIHPWMDAVLMVRENPYVAFTDAEGKFKIENVPAGKWKFQFWHKKFGWLSKLSVEGKSVGKRGEFEVEIKSGQSLDLGAMSLPADAIKK